MSRDADEVGARPDVRSSRAPLKAVWVLIAIYVAVFGTLTWRQQSHFGTFGFDMGIYDQGIWLLSRFREPFVTVRGLNYFGHHVNLITVVFVPFYWLGAGPHFLYLVQTMWMALGALPVWLLARDRLGDAWLAVPLAAAYLLYPSLEWINWWHFHPDALAITPLLFAVWLATRRRWRWFALAIGVTLASKEDAALAVFMLGAVLAFRAWRAHAQALAGADRGSPDDAPVADDAPVDSGGVGDDAAVGNPVEDAPRRRHLRPAVLTMAAGALWFVIATKVVIPRANGGIGPFYEGFFPGFGDSLGEIAWTMIRHPSRVIELATEDGRIEYYKQLLGPVAFVPVLAPALLLVAGPQAAVNVVAGHGYTHDIRFHYSSLVIVAVMLATVEACSRPRRRQLRVAMVGLVAVASLVSNVAWSPSPLGVEYDAGVWAQSNPRHAVVREALDLVPEDAAVSASYHLVPQLTHRVLIYEWPNPWIIGNWGVDGENPADPADVEYVVVDMRLFTAQQQSMWTAITATTHRVVFEKDGMAVAVPLRPG